MTFASKKLFLPAAALRRDAALVHGLVGEHRLPDDVADGEDVGNVGPHLPIDRDEAAFVDRDAGVLGADRFAVGLRPTATRILSKVSVAGALPPSKWTTSPAPFGSTFVTLALRWIAS